MAERDSTRTSRRDLLKHAAAGTGLSLGALLAGCKSQPQGDGKRLKALFSNAGLTGSWNKAGKNTAMLWGDLLGVDVTWVDGEYDSMKQKSKIGLRVDEADWDFCAFQAHEIGVLEKPVRKLKERGIPVISMDTLIVEKSRLREIGVWFYIAGDHFAMAESATRYLMKKIGGRGKVIHIGGKSTHSGARERKRGFEKVVAQYRPDVEVVDGKVHWCNWKTEEARTAFQTLLTKTDEPIAGAFFHNDDMALACTPALPKTPHENMVLTSVDGQAAGLKGVRSGELAATVVNPTCMLHGYSLILGRFIAKNKEKIEDVPLEIKLPCPLVSKEAGNLETMFYLSDEKHCLV